MNFIRIFAARREARTSAVPADTLIQSLGKAGVSFVMKRENLGQILPMADAAGWPVFHMEIDEEKNLQATLLGLPLRWEDGESEGGDQEIASTALNVFSS